MNLGVDSGAFNFDKRFQKSNRCHSIYALLAYLDRKKVHYTLARNRSDVIDVNVTIVGIRTEISVFEDGHIEYSEFIGDESVVSDIESLNSLIEGRVARKLL